MRQESPVSTVFEYEAFISYRHKELDTAAAKAIHRQIENYRIPAQIKKLSGKSKMGRIFRDQDELPLMADLGEGIRHALENSRWLILICTPDMPLSKWCMAEVDYFIELGRRDNILTVLVSGEPEQSFPPQLRFVEDVYGELTEKEPLAADIRAKNKQGVLKKIRSEKLRLLAPMLGVKYDDLKRRARERFLKFIAAASLSGLAAALVIGGVIGAQAINISQTNDKLRLQVEETNRQREIAEENEKKAKNERDSALIGQSLFLASLSESALKNGDSSLAALLALNALPNDLQNPDRPYVAEAETALRNASMTMGRLAPDAYHYTAILDAPGIEKYRLYEDDLFVAVLDREIRMWNTRSGEMYPPISIAARTVVGGVSKFASVYIDRSRPVVRINYGSYVEIYELQPDKKSIIKAQTRIRLGEPDGSEKDIWSGAVIASPDQAIFLYSCYTVNEGHRAFAYDETAGTLTELPHPFSKATEADIYGPRVAAYIGTLSSDETKPGIYVFDILNRELLFELKTYKTSAYGINVYVSFNADGSRIAVTASGVVDLFDAADGRHIATLNAEEATADFYKKSAKITSFSGDGSLLAVMNMSGEVKLYDAATGESVSASLSNIVGMSWFGAKIMVASDNRTISLAAENDSNSYTKGMTMSIFSGIRTEIGSAGSPSALHSVSAVKTGDGETVLAVLLENGGVQIMRTDNALNTPRTILRQGGYGTDISVSGTGRYIAYCNYAGGFTVYDAQTGKTICQTKVPATAATSPDKFKLLQWRDNDSDLLLIISGVLTEYNIETGVFTEICELPYDLYQYDEQNISRDFYAEQGQNTVVISSLLSGKVIREIPCREGMDMFCVQQNGSFVALYGEGCGEIAVYNALTGDNAVNLKTTSCPAALRVSISPDGQYLAAILQNGTFNIWSLPDGKLISNIKVDPVIVDSFMISSYLPDGSPVWEINTYSITALTPFWSADSSHVAFRNGNKELSIYSVTAKRIIGNVGVDVNLSADAGTALTCALSPDGSMLAINNTVYDTTSGKQRFALPFQGLLEWLGNDRVITGYTGDGSAVIWEITPPETLMNIARKTLEGRELSDDERKEFFLE